MSRFSDDILARASRFLHGTPAPPTTLPPAPSPTPPQPAPTQTVELAGVDREAAVLAAVLCRQFEGLVLRPYICPGGIPTIGYGTTQYPDGTLVRLSDAPITRAQADAYLLHDLRTIRLRAVRRSCPGVSDPKVLAALMDFAYNLGIAALAASTLRRRVNEGRWSEARHELGRWVNAKGRVLPGLVKRRAAESQLLPTVGKL